MQRATRVRTKPTKTPTGSLKKKTPPSGNGGADSNQGQPEKRAKNLVSARLASSQAREMIEIIVAADAKMEACRDKIRQMEFDERKAWGVRDRTLTELVDYLRGRPSKSADGA